MTCGVCREAGHSRREHYRPCGVCGKALFFHRLRLRDENEERTLALKKGWRYLCDSCYRKEASPLHAA